MNFIDILLILVISLATYNGWKKGFLEGALDLISWIATLVLGFWLFGYVVEFLESYIKVSGIWLFPLSFLITLLATRFVVASLVSRGYSAIPATAHTHRINNFLGLVPGLISGLIYGALLVTLFLLIPFSDLLTTKSQESVIGSRLTNQVNRVEARISPHLSEAIKRSANQLTVEPASDKTIELPFTVKNPKPKPDLEAQMLILLNKERAKKGLKPLKHDPELVPVARAHCRDMFARGYFSHKSPEGQTPTDRIRAANVSFVTAGENLALAQTLDIAHTGLMNSPGHRANILRPAFGRVGIGILDGGIYGIMVTQNFRN